MRISMSAPDITEVEIEAINKVLRSQYLSIGPEIERFEQAVARYVGVRHTLAVNSGTSGLHIAVVAAGVDSGDIVITTSFSFIASANCVLYERGIPVFVDVDPATGNIDASLVAEAADDLTAGGTRAARWMPPNMRDGAPPGRLKALLPVHTYGQPADMDPIIAGARRHGIPVIEDACEAIGSTYKGHPVGSLGDMAVFAYYPNKQITTGEGGMVATNNQEYGDVLRSLRNQGRDVFDAWLSHSRLGFNYRMDEMSAALGAAQMTRIEELLARREKVANWYNERLAGLDGISRPEIAPNTTRMSWFVYVIRVEPPTTRDEVMHALAAEGIPSRAYFTPIHLQPFYRQRFGYGPGDLPVTERLGKVSLALPFSSIMTESEVDRVAEALLRVISRQPVAV